MSANDLRGSEVSILELLRSVGAQFSKRRRQLSRLKMKRRVASIDVIATTNQSGQPAQSVRRRRFPLKKAQRDELTTLQVQIQELGGLLQELTIWISENSGASERAVRKVAVRTRLLDSREMLDACSKIAQLEDRKLRLRQWPHLFRISEETLRSVGVPTGLGAGVSHAKSPAKELSRYKARLSQDDNNYPQITKNATAVLIHLSQQTTLCTLDSFGKMSIPKELRKQLPGALARLTAGKAVEELKEAGYATRPQGPKKGASITDIGRDAALKVIHNASAT